VGAIVGAGQAQAIKIEPLLAGLAGAGIDSTLVIQAAAFRLAVAAPTAEATPTIVLPTPSGPQTFQIGDTAMNINDGAVNLRKTPGYQNKPASDRITLVPQGERLLIVGGPAEADGLVWWNVEWQGQNGWMAETRASGGRILAPATSQ